ncbi:hypothetical protein QCA50_002729 [Cerrena zonata]|uniref:Thioester reductase (TE) domain-containing protein n=1 Tax=Cerrena zonata TaxID=2478898 RepID=A0AAW0GHN3_9APHY
MHRSDNPSSIRGNGAQKFASTDIGIMIEKWSSLLPPASLVPRQSSTLEPIEIVVLLTGSTGALGADFLDALVRDDRVGHIYTLNRAPSVVDRQRAALNLRELDPEIVSSDKVTSLEGDVSRAGLGLNTHILNKLKQSVTHIIHNAWLVRFIAPLSEFEGYIEGAFSLLDIAASSPHGAQFIYTSSVGIAHFWDFEKHGSVVPEEAHEFPEASSGLGYIESKYVMERLLDRAAQIGHRASVLRLGQICGSTETGVWPTSEWIPIMIKTSFALGCLPLRDTDLLWVPDNILAGALLDYITASEPLPDLMTFVHPQPSTWSKVFNDIGAALGGIPVVPITDWMAKLEALAKIATAEDYRRAPALKILPLFRAMVEDSRRDRPGKPLQFASDKARRFSPTLRNVPPIQHEHARAWVRYWEKQGFIQPNKPVNPTQSRL